MSPTIHLVTTSVKRYFSYVVINLSSFLRNVSPSSHQIFQTKILIFLDKFFLFEYLVREPVTKT